MLNYDVMQGNDGFNLNLLECKLNLVFAVDLLENSFNLNLLECKLYQI